LAVEREINCQNLQEKISNLKCKETILNQKNMRLNTTYNIHDKEIKSLQANLKKYEKDMNKLNDFLALFYQKASSLKNENLNMNSDFVEKLKVLETQSAKIEIEIDRLKENKAELLQEITECERQIMLWERKIQLEREMQETLDPNVGQQELQALKKDLHLKELRLTEIKKQHDAIIIEIDRVVQKRDIIQVKYNQKESQQYFEDNDVVKIKNVKNNNKTQVSKNIELLKTSINQSQKNISNFEKQSQKIEKENINVQNNTETTQQKIENLENELNSFNSYIQSYKLKKLMNVMKIHTSQQKALVLEKILKSGKVSKIGSTGLDSLRIQSDKNKALANTVKDFVKKETDLEYVDNILNELEATVKKEVNL